MSSADRPSEHDAIEATAAAWLAHRDAGFSTSDQLEFNRWRAAEPRHEAAVLRLEGAWTSLQQLRDFRPEAAMHPDQDLLRKGAAPSPRFPRRRPVFAALALGATLTLAAVFWLGDSLFSSGSDDPRYLTTVNGYERVTLADGSLLELNADSDVSVHFTATERRVRLLKGEVHFTVSKNKERPFFVAVGTITVRAVGTAFNVRLGPKTVEVIVTEGKVNVTETATTSSAATADAASAAVLSANERVVIPVAMTGGPVEATVASAAVEKVDPDTIRAALAWQGPWLVFVDTPLAKAAAQFNLRNALQLVVDDAELGVLPIGGSFRADNIEGFVRLLVSGNEIVAERTAPDRIILRRIK